MDSLTQATLDAAIGQGLLGRKYGIYKAPTAIYFEITPHSDGSYELKIGMHKIK